MKGYGNDKRWPFAEGSGPTIAWATAGLIGALGWWRSRPGWVSRLLFFMASGLWLLILYFFRDPNRQTEAVPGQVLSAGDGTVVAIVPEKESQYLGLDMIRVTIFLSITNVHVQRTPISGRVRLVAHRPGQFIQAFRPEASQVNEHIAMVIDTPYGPVLVKQIAGILARRCVNQSRPGDWLTAGRRFGLIKFGSRIDLLLPNNAQILVTVGDTVQAGLTPIARLPIQLSAT